MTFLGGSLITWHSTRQPFITQSTCEAELVALCSALSDLEAQLPLYQELLPSKVWTCELLCDNKSAVSICQAPFGSWRSRHLHLRANVIKERLSQGWTLKHQPGTEMLADLGTKPLASGRFLELMLGLGLHVPPSSTGRPQAKAVSLRARFPSLDPGLLDLGSVPTDARCQSLLRALILLEVLSSLPVGESTIPSSVAPSPHLAIAWTCTVIGAAAAVASLWVLRPVQATAMSVLVLVLSMEVQNPAHWVPPAWLLTLALGFGLGWICRENGRINGQDKGTQTLSEVGSATCREVGTEAPRTRELLDSLLPVTDSLSGSCKEVSSLRRFK